MNSATQDPDNKLLGVVLCGGESKRMGSDKGSLFKDGKPWAALIAEQLKRQGLGVVVSVNARQEEHYRSLLPGETIVCDDTLIKGPLNGLLSVHGRFPDRDLLLMACDLIEMDDATPEQLIRIYRAEPGYDFYVYKHEQFAEPFCAIYTSEALRLILVKEQSGELRSYSLHERFENGNTRYLNINDCSVFKNFNKPG